MQIPFVGFQPVKTSEHMASAGKEHWLQCIRVFIQIAVRISNISNIFSRKTSESLGLSQNGSRKSSLEKSDLGRKPSNELSSSELAGKTNAASAFLLISR